MNDLKQLVEYIVKALVDSPESVEIREVPEEDTTVLELTVAQPDMGKVIGKHGRTIQALRTLLSASAMKQKQRCILELIE